MPFKQPVDKSKLFQVGDIIQYSDGSEYIMMGPGEAPGLIAVFTIKEMQEGRHYTQLQVRPDSMVRIGRVGEP